MPSRSLPALYWARWLRERWGETTWIEHCNAPAHVHAFVDEKIAKD